MVMMSTPDARLCDCNAHISAQGHDHALAGDGSSFELEVRVQLSKIMVMASAFSATAEQITSVDAKLNQLLLQLHARSVATAAEFPSIGSGVSHSHRDSSQQSSNSGHKTMGLETCYVGAYSAERIYETDESNSLCSQVGHDSSLQSSTSGKKLVRVKSCDVGGSIADRISESDHASEGTGSLCSHIQHDRSQQSNASGKKEVQRSDTGDLCDDKPSNTALTNADCCETIREQEDAQYDSEFSPSKLSFMRRMSESSQESLALAAKSLDAALHLHRVDACRLRMWTLLDDPDSSCTARIIYVVMVCLIIASIPLKLMQTVDDLPVDIKILSMVDTVFDAVFILEVFLRFFFCPLRWAFFRNNYNIIDICSALPMVIRCTRGFVVPATQDEYNAVDFVLIIFVPTLRLLKLLRRFKHLRLLRFTVDIALEALVVPLFLLFIICLAFSGFIYVLEPRDNITSLPHAVWLVVVTVSTVGYGDTLPSTPGGYVVATILVAGGVLYMAVPISIIGQAWNSVWVRRDEILLMDMARERLRSWGYTAADMEKLFEAFDLNEDELLDIDEFSTMLKEMRIGLSTQRVAELFDTLDGDKSGFVDHAEFAKALFPEQYLEVVRQRSLQQSREHRRRMHLTGHTLRRTLSGFSNLGSRAKETSEERSSPKQTSPKSGHASPTSPKTLSRSHHRTDEHPSVQIHCMSPPLPTEDRPTTVPKSALAGFISEASSMDAAPISCCALSPKGNVFGTMSGLCKL